MDVRSALDARNRADLNDVRFRILVALPFALLGLLFANGLGLLLWAALWQFGVRIGLGIAFPAFNVLLAVMIFIDVNRRPQETWFQPRYFQTDGSVKGHEFGTGSGDPLVTYHLERAKGALGGMPLMTSVSDPHNLGQRGRAISSGFANLILGGPRSIAAALADRRRLRDRSGRRTVSAAERFTSWLGSKGVVPEADVRAHLEAHPDQAEGLALARELEIVTRRRIQEGFHYHLR